MYIVLIIVSLGLLWGGALFLTTGSVSLAAKLGMSEFFIGLTIVAVGTSMPEFFVSVLAAIGGNSSISVGNIVGSDIFNAMLSWVSRHLSFLSRWHAQRYGVISLSHSL